uniref:Uncharacterized protein n=1 Tax=Salix viminalis TaxID=40686 RepID=A0A6N2MBP2_SALVM
MIDKQLVLSVPTQITDILKRSSIWFIVSSAGSEQSSYKAYEVTLPTTVDGSKCTGITPEKCIHLVL